MKRLPLLFACIAVISSCTKPTDPLTGTWRLVLSKSISQGKTEVTTPPKEQEMIKMFNGSNFAFFTHDLTKGKGANPIYESGSGTYKLTGSDYSEHLVFCNYREWENRDFKFTLEFKNDTLVQRGIEKIENLHINREIIEMYVRKL